jgi:hypothetical protein
MMNVPELASRLLWVMVLVLASLVLLVGQAGWYVSGQDDPATYPHYLHWRTAYLLAQGAPHRQRLSWV